MIAAKIKFKFPEGKDNTDVSVIISNITSAAKDIFKKQFESEKNQQDDIIKAYKNFDATNILNTQLLNQQPSKPSKILIDNRVNPAQRNVTFTISHPDIKKIGAASEAVSGLMKSEGFTPITQKGKGM